MKEEEHECVGHVNLALEPDHIPGLQPGNTPHLPRCLLTAARTSHIPGLQPGNTPHLPRRLLTAAQTSPRRRPGTGPRSPR